MKILNIFRECNTTFVQGVNGIKLIQEDWACRKNKYEYRTGKSYLKLVAKELKSKKLFDQ